MRRTTDVNTASRNDGLQDEHAGDIAAGAAESGTVANPQAIDAKIQERLGRQLKALYDDVVRQPVPDRLLDLIAQLEEKKGPDTI